MSDSNERWQKIIKSILNFKELVNKRKLFNELFHSRQLVLVFVESKCKRGNHSFSTQLTKLFSFKRNLSCFLSMVLVKASAKFGWINLLKYVCTLKLPLEKNPLLKKLPQQISWSSPILALSKISITVARRILMKIGIAFGTSTVDLTLSWAHAPGQHVL